MTNFQTLLDSKLKEWDLKEEEDGFDLPVLYSFFMKKYNMNFNEVSSMKLCTLWGLLSVEREQMEMNK